MTSQSFAPSDEELDLATRILASKGLGADSEELRGATARDIFNRSGLHPAILRDVWSIADENRSGDLSRDEVAIALRLIGWVQAGEPLHRGLLSKPGPLPTLDGITSINHHRRSVVPQITVFPPVHDPQIREYKRTFLTARPINGVLPEDKVMNSYMSSDLSYEDLRKIINVVDRSSRRALDFSEFACGMYLIQALQSSQLHSIPDSLPPDLFDQFGSAPTQSPSPKAPHLQHRQSASLQIHPRQASLPTPSPPSTSHVRSRSGSRSTTPVQREMPAEQEWDIPVQERNNSEIYFYKLDEAGVGFIERDTFQEFVSIYKVAADLDQIWNLVDFAGDGHMTRDAFTVALRLVKLRVSGEEVPITLPSKLIPPSLRSRYPSPNVVSPLSPRYSTKKPPPVPPKKRDSLSYKRPPVPTSSLPTTPSAYNGPMTPPMSPPLSPVVAHQMRPMLSSSSSSSSSLASVAERITVERPTRPPPNIPAPEVEPELAVPPSPFEDPPDAEAEVFSASPNDISFPQPIELPPQPPLLPAQPPPPTPDTSQQDAFDGFKEEISRLSRQVESLLGQLANQNKLRDSNDNLRTENDRLKTQVRDVERMMAEVLSLNESHHSNEHYAQDIARLMGDLSAKEAQCESHERTLGVLREEEGRLRESLRTVQLEASKASAEASTLRETVSTQADEVKVLKRRLEDLEKVMAEPTDSATSDRREMKVLIMDVTKENEKLKSQVRDMQRSMEQMLLSTKHAAYDEMGRENRMLREHVRDLEGVVNQLQLAVGVPTGMRDPASRSGAKDKGKAPASSSSSSTPNGNGNRSAESLTRENDRLRTEIKEGNRTFSEFRSSSETRLVALQQDLDRLNQENARLKMDMQSRPGMSREDNSVPPPAYDDSFVIPR